MKHRIVTIAGSVLCLCTAFLTPQVTNGQSQEPPGAGAQAGGAQGVGEEKAQKVAQVLNLSPQQESQLSPILQAEAPKIKAVTQDPNLTPAEKREKLKSIHSETDPLVKSILNPTQYKQWQTIRNAELQHMK